MAAIILVLKDVKIKAETIPVHMHQGRTATKIPKIRVKHPP